MQVPIAVSDDVATQAKSAGSPHDHPRSCKLNLTQRRPFLSISTRRFAFARAAECRFGHFADVTLRRKDVFGGVSELLRRLGVVYSATEPSHIRQGKGISMSELARTIVNRRRQAEVSRHLRNLPTFVVCERIPAPLREQLRRLDAAEKSGLHAAGNAR
ncbi:hypothetical protein VSX64_21210 [Aurantimonas sp. C2-6-R+9]|uniref:hypothetical protein n=2 Tax=Aurantimonas TaxID=182269 RepID=UPI002E17B322|nr:MULTISPECIES: hypothetical protein [unclassified Aurantimonas]MEC5293176.1 hypothetical protein [Aurantimonas sp. C2-3-R2]MEC5383322.1 hypothetical protein [Aurantimonas sp. C2-6-R+9]MEC5414271.1 hypothetical protein [Aurantimonas sp. C2-4-R8]